MGFEEFRQRMGEFLHGATMGRYESELRRQTAELNDLFLLLCFMEATALPNPATLSSVPPSASTTPAFDSSAITFNRSAGYLASSGTYAPPAFSTPRIPTTSPAVRSMHRHTRTSGPTPSALSLHATWFARAFSSP